MACRRIHRDLALCSVVCFISAALMAAPHQGQVTFRGGPVPGAVVTAAQADKKVIAITDQQGLYSFGDLGDGVWSVEVSMFGFEGVKRDISVGANAPPAKWELTLLPMERIVAGLTPAAQP